MISDSGLLFWATLYVRAPSMSCVPCLTEFVRMMTAKWTLQTQVEIVQVRDVHAASDTLSLIQRFSLFLLAIFPAGNLCKSTRCNTLKPSVDNDCAIRVPYIGGGGCCSLFSAKSPTFFQISWSTTLEKLVKQLLLAISSCCRKTVWIVTSL